MKIGIIGSRGIPNNYGGFEQFAEHLSLELVKRGHDITVYNSGNHPYKKNEWNGVKIIHCKDPEDKIGTAGQFIYDRNCILDSKKRHFDVILQLGYTSSSVWGRWLPKKSSVITTNMDGLEWKRSKYSGSVQRFLKYAEKLGVKHSHYLIADSKGIQEYLKKTYNRESTYIPYGANVFDSPDEEVLQTYNLQSFGYNMLIARLEPENNIETILDGIVQSNSSIPFLVIGNHETKYGAQLKSKYSPYSSIRFMGAIYNQNHLNNLRYFSGLYFHGHSVGGTNPSLLEAMASSAVICAHDNVFNATILGKDALYFSDANTIAEHIKGYERGKHVSKIKANLLKIESTYSWETIADQYEAHFVEILSEHSSRP